MIPKCLLRLTVALIMVFTIEAPVLAAGPTERVKQTTDKIISILNDPALIAPDKAKHRIRMLREAVDERFDWEEFSRRALATHWRKRTEEEKREFIPLFGKLVERTYRDKVDNYSGEKVYYVGERIEGEYALVRAKIVTSKNRKIAVDYRLRNKRNDWFVYDVFIEGVSFVNNYRVQFNSIIISSSYQELVERLKEKVAEE